MVGIDIEGLIGFRRELNDLINRYGMENGSNTPDYILRDYLCSCLVMFDETIQQREAWYGRLAKSENKQMSEKGE